MDAPVLADILLERVVNSELSCEEQIFEQLDSNGSGSLEEEDVIRFITSQGYVYASAFDPTTFTGFIDWAMIVFGLAFIGILIVGLTKHDALERAARPS